MIGHAVHNDLYVMEIPHPKHQTVDTAKCAKLRWEANFVTHQAASLKRLSTALLGNFSYMIHIFCLKH